LLPHGSLPSKSQGKCLATLAGQFSAPDHPPSPSPPVCTHCTLLGIKVRLSWGMQGYGSEIASYTC